MPNLRHLPQNSMVKGVLPISCVRCQHGSKMVLLVTGLCSHDCYYCPLSLEKKGQKVTYANEKLVKRDEDVIFEARSIDAKGTGITGGDPLLAMKETLHYIELLKSEFGGRHDIHLYTSTTNLEKITSAAEAGLDEIRFHPPPEVWHDLGKTEYIGAISHSLGAGLKTGVEITAIPGLREGITRLAEELEKLGAGFLNLNELEYSESNWRELNKRGFTVKDDISSAVKGSEELAMDIMNTLDNDMTIHYCSSAFKDATQLRNRIMRRARNVARPYDIITPDGTFIKGVIEATNLEPIKSMLKDEFDIPENLYAIDDFKNRIEIAPWILEEIHPEIDGQCFIVEEYPTADALEVERRPL